MKGTPCALVHDLEAAKACVERVAALGGTIKSALVSRHGATITLADPGDLLDHLDAQQIPVIRTCAADMAMIDGCLVSWPLR